MKGPRLGLNASTMPQGEDDTVEICRRIGPGLLEYDVVRRSSFSSEESAATVVHVSDVDSTSNGDCNSSLSSAEFDGELKNLDELNGAGIQDEDAQEDEIEMLVQEVLLDIVSDEEVVYPGQTLTLF
jgi:hypothetical protein